MLESPVADDLSFDAFGVHFHDRIAAGSFALPDLYWINRDSILMIDNVKSHHT